MLARRSVRGGLWVLLLFAAGQSLHAQNRPIIMIDPGHGGDQPGVRAGEVLEKDVALRASFVLAEAFVARGYDVRFTRTGDYNIPNADRRTAAEGAGAALMLSMHFNGNADESRHGIEIYGNLEDPRVADIGERIGAALRADGTPVDVLARGGQFLTSPVVPTLMIEAGFLTHPVEHRLVMSSAYHRDLAAAIVEATVPFVPLP